jgi:hypothetical protein
MLSEKARGKQRATNNDDTEDAPEQPRSVTIRFTEHEPDLLLSVASHDTVRDLKALVSGMF